MNTIGIQFESMKSLICTVATLQIALMMASPLVAADNTEPCAYFILVDQSTSMNEVPKNSAISWKLSKHDEVTQQLADFTTSLPSESRIVAYTFARDLRNGPDVILGSDQERATLQKFFAALKADGDRTHLWSALNKVLTDAGRFAEQNPGRPVKVLVYSDGEDNEQDGPGLPGVLKQHQRLLKDHVKLTYVTLGFTLRSDLKAAIREFGTVRESMTAADVLPLIADFSWVPQNPVAGERVHFIDHGSGVIRDRLLNFGDGAAPTSRKSPQHVFNQPGDYIVRSILTATDGSQVVETRTIKITERPALKPAFRVSADEVHVGKKVFLINETDGEGLSFKWDLGNGKTSTERNPSVVLNKLGEYSFGLKITDRHGQAAETHSTTPVRVIPLPKPQVEIVGSMSVVVGDESLFVAQIHGEFERAEWLLEDKKPVSNSLTLRHKFDEPRRHQLMVVVHSKAGDVTVTHAVTAVALPLPKPSFVVSSDAVEIGDNVVVVDTTPGELEYVVWDLGEGRTIRRDYGDAAAPDVRRVVVSFNAAAEHAIQMTAFGPGGSATSKKSIQVNPPAAPTARLSLADIKRLGDQDTAVTVSIGETLRLVDRSTGKIETSTWMVNDEIVSGSADGTLDYLFNKVGDQVVVRAASNSGGESRHVFHVRVEPFAAPKAAVVVGSDKIQVGESVVFTVMSAGTADAIDFDFGDETPKQRVTFDSSTPVRTVSHLYANAGLFDLTASITGPGGTDTVGQKIEVRPSLIPPVAELVPDKTEGHNELTVRFTNKSSGSVTRSEFDFGDGTQKTVDGNGDVEHTFGPGEHIVWLTAHGLEGVAPSKAKIVIKVSAPISKAEFWGWIGGLGFLLAAIVGFVSLPYIRAAREYAESLLVGGVITVRTDDPDSEPTIIPLPAESREATFGIGPSMHGVLKSVDNEGRNITYRLDVFRDSELTKAIDMPIAKDITESGFVIRYVP